MSLRADIHAALDEVSPPAPSLASELDAFIREQSSERRARVTAHGWPARLRGATSMVAALLVIVLVAGVVVGGRVWRDWNTYQIQQATKADLAKLEAKPLLPLVTIQPGAECPSGPLVDAPQDTPGSIVAFGRGPFYAEWGKTYAITSWGTWTATYFYIAPRASGPMLIRARDLVTGQRVAFALAPDLVNTPLNHVTFGDGIPTGDIIIDHDKVLQRTVRGYSELFIDPSLFAAAARKGDYLSGYMFMGYPKGTFGYNVHTTACVSYQVDGPNFTEVLVIGF
jgi:hypothetical protein